MDYGTRKLMVGKEKKNNCHSRMFLAGIQKNGCPTKAFGHDNFNLLGAIPIVLKISYENSNGNWYI